MSLATDWEGAAPIATRPGPNLSDEWSKAKPLDFKAPAAKPPAKKTPILDMHPEVGLGEAALSMGSGMLAKPVSDIAGLAATGKEMLSPTPGGGDPAAFKRSVQEGLTYEPRTSGGAAMEKYNPMALLGRGIGWVGEKAGQIAAPPGRSGPVRSAIGHGIEEAVPQAMSLLGARTSGGKAAPREIPKDVKTLMERDIPMTPGQISPKLSRAEQAMGSWPLIGAPIKEARGRGVEAMNRAAWNDALKAAGEKEMPASVKSGNEASQYVREKLGDRYDSLLGKMVGRLDAPPAKNALPAPGQLGQPPKPSLRQELDTLLDLAKQDGGLPSKEMRQLRRIVDKEIKARFDKSGTAPGESLKAIQETLRKEEAAFRQGGPYERKLADAIKEADAAVRRMVRESNPKQAAELDKIDAGYARFKIAQRAAGSVGAREGTFKPSGYDRAVQVSDKSKDHARYSEGRAMQQDLSGAAKRTLSDDLPNSGTPDRLLMAELASRWVRNPATAAAYTVGAIPAHILYSPMGIRMMQSLLTNPPNMRGAAGPMMVGSGQVGAGMLPPPPEQ